MKYFHVNLEVPFVNYLGSFDSYLDAQSKMEEQDPDQVEEIGWGVLNQRELLTLIQSADIAISSGQNDE